MSRIKFDIVTKDRREERTFRDEPQDLFAQEEPATPPTNEMALVPRDINGLKTEMATVEQNIEALVKQAEGHAITDDVTAVAATDIVGKLVKLDKEIEKRRKAEVEEPNEYVKKVNAFCKGLSGMIQRGVAAIDARQRAYRAAQLAKQREIEARERAAREALQKEIDKAAKKGGYEAPIVPQIVIPEVEKVTRGDSGASTHFRKEWKFEIANESEVPREYCMVDERKIRAAVKAGIRTIAGVRIYEDEVPIHRTI